MPFTQLVLLQFDSNGSAVLPPIDEGNCTDGVAPWIWTLLEQCALDNQRYASLIFGLISLVAWTVAAFPQLYKNCKEGIPDVALSPFMLINWMLGDGLNLVGAILSKQLPFQIYVAAFYVGSDVINLSQFAYFKIKNGLERKRKGRLMNSYPPSNGYRQEVLVPVIIMFVGFTAFGFSDVGSLAIQQSSMNVDFHRRPGGRTLLAIPASFVFPDVKTSIGYALGCVSAILYFASRVPQLIKNFQRKCTEGLSLFLFVLALVGNGTYGLSIFLQSVDGVFLIQHFPWLMGSVGVMVLDAAIAFQFYLYRKTENDLDIQQKPDERTRLLKDDHQQC